MLLTVYFLFLQIYRRRWYILFIFSMLSCLQFMIWNAFGPIYSSIEYAYKWSDTTVAIMPNWGTITFMIFVFPFVMLVEKKGLKISAILMASLIFAGAALRAISTEDSTFLYLAHFGSILNGIAGALVMSAPSALSSVWFPANERMIATCISQSAAFMGSGFAFIGKGTKNVFF